MSSWCSLISWRFQSLGALAWVLCRCILRKFQFSSSFAFFLDLVSSFMVRLLKRGFLWLNRLFSWGPFWVV
jgi:hypothetical protein